MLSAWNAVSALDHMFDDVMGSAFGTATNSRTFEPAIDVHATSSEILFVCDVPGVKQEDLEITLANHVLTIKGTRRFQGNDDRDDSDDKKVMLGRAYGTFTRAYTLPESLDEDALSADLQDGVLTVRIPKHPKAKPRRIEIRSGAKRLEE